MSTDDTSIKSIRIREPRRIDADDTEGHVRTYPHLVDDQQPDVRPPRPVEGTGRTYPDVQPD